MHVVQYVRRRWVSLPYEFNPSVPSRGETGGAIFELSMYLKVFRTPSQMLPDAVRRSSHPGPLMPEGTSNLASIRETVIGIVRKIYGVRLGRSSYIGLGFALLLLGCTPVSSSQLKPPTAEQRQQFERDGNLTFPPTAELLAWREERGIDGAAWLKFKIPAADFAAFIARSPLQNTSMSGRDKYLEDQFRDLLPVAPAHYRAGQQALPGGRVLNMLADETDAKIIVVYLMLHET